MTTPRFSISNLMALVLLVAVEIWACKTFLEPPLVGGGDMYDLILFGMLPMANVLLLDSLPFWTRAGRARERPGLVGFEVFGAMALFLFFACCLAADHAIHEGVGDTLRHLCPGYTIFLTSVVLVFLLPQLALASLGAWLGGGYKIRVKVVVERRNFAEPGEPSSKNGAIDSPMSVGGLEVG